MRTALKNIAIQVGCSEATLRRHFSSLCNIIVSRYLGRFDNDRIRSKLEKVLSSDGLVPSMDNIAQQLGTTRELIRRRFPELSKDITIRRSNEQKQIHENTLIETSSKIRRIILLFHQQDIYPSHSRVASYLENPSVFWYLFARDTWKATMRELGYLDND